MNKKSTFTTVATIIFTLMISNLTACSNDTSSPNASEKKAEQTKDDDSGLLLGVGIGAIAGGALGTMLGGPVGGALGFAAGSGGGAVAGGALGGALAGGVTELAAVRGGTTATGAAIRATAAAPRIGSAAKNTTQLSKTASAAKNASKNVKPSAKNKAKNKGKYQGNIKKEPLAKYPAVKCLLRTLAKGKPYPFKKDGTVFRNREGRLPVKSDKKYYHEYTVTGCNENNYAQRTNERGVLRLVVGKGGEMYYTPDHYKTFVELI